eukprot:758493-Hanusia_phi.AAC.9
MAGRSRTSTGILEECWMRGVEIVAQDKHSMMLAPTRVTPGTVTDTEKASDSVSGLDVHTPVDWMHKSETFFVDSTFRLKHAGVSETNNSSGREFLDDDDDVSLFSASQSHHHDFHQNAKVPGPKPL